MVQDSGVAQQEMYKLIMLIVHPDAGDLNSRMDGPELAKKMHDLFKKSELEPGQIPYLCCCKGQDKRNESSFADIDAEELDGNASQQPLTGQASGEQNEDSGIQFYLKMPVSFSDLSTLCALL